MVNNLFLCIIIFSIVIYIINYTKNTNTNTNTKIIENFNKNNFNFLVDTSKLSYERSVRFSKNNRYNQSRIVYGFNDLNYFNENIDNIFNLYGINDDKLKTYFKEKYNSIKKNKDIDMSKLPETEKKCYKSLIQNDYNEVGIGHDKKVNTHKIYILIGKTIYSLKKLNNNLYVESVYNDNYLLKKKEIISYLGKDTYDIIEKYINLLKILEGPDLNIVLKKMPEISKEKNLKTDITEFENYFDSDLSKYYLKKYKKLENLQYFTRYDNKKMMGYNFNLYDKELMVGESKSFLFNLLKELGCNVDGFDNWVKENKDLMITYISFIKNSTENIVTVYYSNDK